jgi:hypothetical protein
MAPMRASSSVPWLKSSQITEEKVVNMWDYVGTILDIWDLGDAI